MPAAPLVVVPFRAPPETVPRMTSVRSTLISSSLSALRERGLEDAYFAALAAEHHPAMQSMVAGAWIPTDLALAHYGAIDSLGISTAEAVEIGRKVGVRVQGSILSVIVRLATGAGATPWTAYAQIEKLWGRMFLGGAVEIVKLAHKEARIEMVQMPLLASPYFRAAFRGLVAVGTELFSLRCFVTEIGPTRHGFAFRTAWA